MNIKVIALTLTTTSLVCHPTQSQAQQIIIQQGSTNATATGNNAIAHSSISQNSRQSLNSLRNFLPTLSNQWGTANSNAIGNDTRADSQIRQRSNQNFFSYSRNNLNSQFSNQQSILNSNAIDN